MDIDRYQEESRKSILRKENFNLPYHALGLAGETGEVVEKIKKLWRDDDNQLTDAHKDAIAKELGDVLWYMARIADLVDRKLSDIAADNFAKGLDRMNRGKITGNGDNR